jgi:hypothetical protein
MLLLQVLMQAACGVEVEAATGAVLQQEGHGCPHLVLLLQQQQQCK